MTADEDDLTIDVGEIQGDVIYGFRKEHQAFAFARFGDLANARKAIGKLLKMVTTGQQLLDSRLIEQTLAARASSVWINLGFTYEGLVQLAPGLEGHPLLRDLGQARQQLEDLLPSGPPKAQDDADGDVVTAAWEVCGEGAWPDLVVNVAWIGEKAPAALEQVTTILTTHDLEVLDVQRGDRPKGMMDREHFGFRDGLSKYAIRGLPVPSTQQGDGPHPPKATLRVLASGADALSGTSGWPPVKKGSGPLRDRPASDMEMKSVGLPLLWPGQVLLGNAYPRQDPSSASSPLCAQADNGLDPEDPLLVPFLSGDDADFFTNGSFMVWVRFEQDVPKFWAAAQAHADELNDWLDLKAGGPGRPVTAEDAAALFVGRRLDGSPLSLRPVFDPARPQDGALRYDDELDEGALNHFSYLTERPAEGGVPAVPTDLDAQLGGARCPLHAHVRKTNPRTADALATTMLRRSIPFGDRVVDPLHPTEAELEGHRGLLFVCYQASIAKQFETIQRNWISQPGRPEREGAPDAFTSTDALQEGSVRTAVRHPFGGGSRWMDLESGFVHMRGGTYLFVPSMEALRHLASGRAYPTRERR